MYTCWLYAAGGSVKACEDQSKIQELLTGIKEDSLVGKDFYYTYEPFDPRLLSKFYGISLSKTFEQLLVDQDTTAQQVLSEKESQVPVLPDEHFKSIDERLRPGTDTSAQQRYDIAVKMLIRDCAKQNVRKKANIKPDQPQGLFTFSSKPRRWQIFTGNLDMSPSFSWTVASG